MTSGAVPPVRRSALYRGKIDDLLRRAAAAAALENPTDLFEMRRERREGRELATAPTGDGPVTPQKRAARLSDAEIRAAWRKATIHGRVGRFAEDGLTVELPLDEAGLNVPARSSCADPPLHVALDSDWLLVAATDEASSVATTLEDGRWTPG